MEVVQEHVTVIADRAQLAELRRRLRALCAQLDIRPSTMRRLVLAVDEATSNIMEHARVEPGSTIEISLEIAEESITARIRDRGVQFDPSENKRTLVNSGLGHRRGFGLYLIHLITDGVHHQRTDDGRNVLTLKINSR